MLHWRIETEVDVNVPVFGGKVVYSTFSHDPELAIKILVTGPRVYAIRFRTSCDCNPGAIQHILWKMVESVNYLYLFQVKVFFFFLFMFDLARASRKKFCCFWKLRVDC